MHGMLGGWGRGGDEEEEGDRYQREAEEKDPKSELDRSTAAFTVAVSAQVPCYVTVPLFTVVHGEPTTAYISK